MMAKRFVHSTFYLGCFLSLISFNLVSQGFPPGDWFHSNAKSTGFSGINVEEAYNKILSAKSGQAVIVAVLDSGVDIDHEDLKDVIWVNADEIPGNQKDDDGNGYIDDIHGWNFIGSKDGQNIVKETLEVTRLYGKLRNRYEGVNISNLSKKKKKEYALYQSYKKTVERKRKAAQKKVDEITEREDLIIRLLSIAQKLVGDAIVDQKMVDTLKASSNEEVILASRILESVLEQDIDELTLPQLKELVHLDFEFAREHYASDLDFTYNPEYNSRAIIGDDYENPNDRNYGNADVGGGFAFHGTHVAGIIGASRNNDVGINGLADQVRIMSVRVVPDGDEHDKDVANAIRYAVDNGASVINMSFGKGQSWDKQAVDKAVKYASKNDVLIVHAAGNSGAENTGMNNFPNPSFEKKGIFRKKKAKNWIEVGASSYQKGESIIAGFSNYGKTQVDLFAPGVAIYSTAPGNGYAFAQGTSMASPVVAGTAALIRSYFPYLKAKQVRDILIESARPINGKVVKPGTYERVQAKELSATGGLLDAYAAIALASKYKGGKKLNRKSPIRS